MRQNKHFVGDLFPLSPLRHESHSHISSGARGLTANKSCFGVFPATIVADVFFFFLEESIETSLQISSCINFNLHNECINEDLD